MQGNPSDLLTFVRTALEAAADPARAAKMASYLKTEMPMFGASRPEQKRVAAAAARAYPAGDPAQLEAQVRALHAQPHREEKAVALDLCQRYKRLRSADLLPLYADLIRAGAWWDLVDGVATHLVGDALASERARVTPELDRWMSDPDLWIRRSAVISQVRHKDGTDAELLFRLCAQGAPERTFWMRKAIGWALREYAKTAPDAVQAFLDAQGDALSGLSRREAARGVAMGHRPR